jgi:hypothetical protein
MHRWIQEQTGSLSSGSLAALFYVLGPLITLRTCILEHSGMAMSFVFVPWIFRGIFILTRRKSFKEVFILGFCAAGLALSYAKVAILMIPLCLLWALASLPWAQKGKISGFFFSMDSFSCHFFSAYPSFSHSFLKRFQNDGCFFAGPV